MADRGNTVTMQGVTLIFRNFKGRKSRFNQDGTRNFGVLLDPETAEAMLADEWNVKFLEPRDDDEEGVRQPWLPVEADYVKGRPPRVVTINDEGEREDLGEEEIAILDNADIVNVDMIVAPWKWEVNGKTGVKAYLRSIYVTIEEDELEKKYRHLERERHAPEPEPDVG